MKGGAQAESHRLTTGGPTWRAEFAAKWSTLAAVVVAAFYFSTSLYIASHRLLWFDEIATAEIARLPQWVSIWKVLGRGADSMPPGYFMLVRTFGKLLGHPEVALRLPSALAMAAGMLITFNCARRLTDGIYGLIALSVLTCSYLPYYGYEARSYAIYFMLSALALWIWTCTKVDKRSATISFGLVFLLGVSFHYYFVLCLVPYALWEISRWKPWQLPSPRLIAGVMGATLALVITSPMALAFARNFSSGRFDRPSLATLLDVFSQLFPGGLLLLAIITVWIAWTSKDDQSISLQAMQPAEIVGWLSLCIPLAGFVAAELVTNAFPDRGFIGALPGIAVAFTCCLSRHFRNALGISLGIFLLLLSTGIVKQARVVHHLEKADKFDLQTNTRAYLRVEPELRNDNKQFIAFSPTMLYVGAQYYSKHAEQLIMLRSLGNDLRRPELLFSLMLDRPVQWWGIDDLKKHARETALILPSAEVVDAMREAGFKIEVRFSRPLEVVYFQ